MATPVAPFLTAASASASLASVGSAIESFFMPATIFATSGLPSRSTTRTGILVSFFGPGVPPKIEAKNDAMPIGTRNVISIALRSPKNSRRSFQRRAKILVILDWRFGIVDRGPKSTIANPKCL